VTTIWYIGRSDHRVLTTANFISVGVNDQTTVTWDGRGTSQEVSTAAAAILVLHPDFDDEAPEGPPPVASDAVYLARNLNLADVFNPGQARRNIGARGWPLVGVMSARPLATASGGDLYLATDVNGGTLYYSNGLAWLQVGAGSTEASGQILGQAVMAPSLLSSTQGNASIGLDLGLSVTVTGTGRPIAIEWGGQFALSLNGQASGSLVKGAVDLVDAAVNPVGTPNSTVLDSLQISGRLTGDTYYTTRKVYIENNLSPGVSRTYNLRMHTNAGGGAVAGSITAFGTSLGTQFSLLARQG
jgi:hypothetical protein